MEYVDEILKSYPDPMSKKQFREVSCISNTTATFLLESGLVPSQRVGKAKFFYEIRKSDVADYLRQREKQPSAYAPPKQWYRTHPERQPPAFSLLRSLDYTKLDRALVRAWYGRKLCRWPDLLRAEEIARITGYHPHSVSRWCTEKTMPSIIVRRLLYVPKEYLLDFLTSDTYNGIHRKSRQHYDDIRQITAELSKEKAPATEG